MQPNIPHPRPLVLQHLAYKGLRPDVSVGREWNGIVQAHGFLILANAMFYVWPSHRNVSPD